MAAERLVAVTQRVVEVASHGEVRDCLDQQWAAWLAGAGFTAVPIPNRIADVAGYLARLDVHGVVLTGGNNLAMPVYDTAIPVLDAFETRDRTELAVLEHCAETGLPVLGYCRGLQVLHVFEGGRLVRLGDGDTGHVGTVHEVELRDDDWRRLVGASTLEVNSFHDYGFRADAVGSAWDVAAVTPADGVVEGLVHRTLPFIGVGWHPERAHGAATFDRTLLERHFDPAGARVGREADA